MIKGVIFDMDGVLVDNSHIHTEAFARFCNGFGVELNVDTLMEVFGMGNDDIIPRLIPAELLEGKDIDALGVQKEDIYREIFEEKIEPTRGLIEFIRDIRAKGYKTAIGSSAPLPNVEFVIRKCNMDGLFDAIVNGDMVALRKPAPDIYLKAAELIGLAPSECVVIEDAYPGVESARAAGASLIGLSTTFKKEILETWNCDLIAKDFTELSVETLENL